MTAIRVNLSWGLALPLSLAVLLCACGGNAPTRKTVSIGELNAIIRRGISQSDTALQQYTVTGYYSNSSGPMLMSNYKLLLTNSKIDDTDYIALTGAGVDSLAARGALSSPDTAKRYVGALVQADIDLKLQASPVKHLATESFNPEDTVAVRVDTKRKPTILRAAERLVSFIDHSIKTVWPAAHRIAANGQVPEGDPTKFALLFSGGINRKNARPRYWNDLRFMYRTLVDKYDFLPENIRVIYTNGSHVDGFGDTTEPINYAATDANFRQAVNELSVQLTSKSTFFVYFSNHGGGWNTDSGRMDGGRHDDNGDEEATDTKTWDEEVFYYQQGIYNHLWDDSLTNIFRGIQCKTFVMLLEPCYGGGLIHDLRAPNRVLISAANEYEQSFGQESDDTYDQDYDFFSFYFITALNGATEADTNHDGKISMLEAFNFAKLKVNTEHPQLDDSGDGIGTNTPAAAASHGKLANNTFLR